MRKRSQPRNTVFIAILVLLILALVSARHCRDGMRRFHPPRTVSRVAPRPVPQEARILLVGDIMLSRGVAAQMRNAQDWDLPFRDVRDFLRSADLNFGNLESPFSTRGRATPHGSMIFNAPPPGVQGLEDYGFRVVSLANNHAFDQGADGLAYTLQHLHEHHVQTVGAGHSLAEAWRPALFEVKDMKVGFLAASYASINDNGSATNPYVARIADLGRLTVAVSNLASQRIFVIVSMHAGTEYTSQPNARQIAFAHAAIDAGASVVVGHHPHWTQPFERYKGGLIFYSLGNFVFDQGQAKDTREGLAVKLHLLQGRLLSADLQPIEIERYCCPHLAPGTAPIQVRP